MHITTPPSKTGSIDYRARELFLPATTNAAEAGWGKASPIKTLATLLPEFCEWMEYVWAQPMGQMMLLIPPRPAIRIALSERNGRPKSAAGLDHPRALPLKRAIEAWMRSHRFSDAWIADTALLTLLAHVHLNVPDLLLLGPQLNLKCVYDASKPALRWCIEGDDEDRLAGRLQVPWKRVVQANGLLGQWESLETYLTRFDRLYLDTRKKIKKSYQFRTGARATQERPACLTAARFAGASYAALAESESVGAFKASDADLVEKTVKSFCKRAGISLPGKKKFTLADSLAAPSGNDGKAGEIQGYG